MKKIFDYKSKTGKKNGKPTSALVFFLFVISLLSAHTIVSAADQIKSEEFIVMSSPIIVAAPVTTPFSLYIGDDLTGVTNPLKSVYFPVTGVYTGGGSITLSLDGDSATAQTFTLPAVGVPTPFEFLYNDNTGKLAIASAGTYAHSLTLTPSGVSIAGLSVTMETTHEYVPPACPDGLPSNQKVKTNDFYVTGSNTNISSATTTTLNLYIGDNISGVTNAVKSAFFTVSGVYTGGGSIAFSLNGDPASVQTFTLPAVGSPTAFELLYKDATGIINPLSGGNYQYTLALTPAGVTISGLSVTFTETHQYKPEICLSAIPIKGELYSAVFDTTGTSTGPAYNSFSWKGALGGIGENEGKIRFQLAASDCANGTTNFPTCSAGSWSFIGGGTCSVADWFDAGATSTPFDLVASGCTPSWNNKRYFRYVVELCSNDCVTAGNNSPRVDGIIVNWAP